MKSSNSTGHMQSSEYHNFVGTMSPPHERSYAASPTMSTSTVTRHSSVHNVNNMQYDTMLGHCTSRLGSTDSIASLERTLQMTTEPKCYTEMKPLIDKLKNLGNDKLEELCTTIRDSIKIISNAWSRPTEVTYVCSVMRNFGILEMLVKNITTPQFNYKAHDKKEKMSPEDTFKRRLVLLSGQLLSLMLTQTNTKHLVTENICSTVTKNSFDNSEDTESMTTETIAPIIKRAWDFLDVDVDVTRSFVSIFEGLFKYSENTCRMIVRAGGLEFIIRACTSMDPSTLRHGASALANLALFGGKDNQEAMILAKVADWLFPLANNNEPATRYYACLAIAILTSNPALVQVIEKSGTLKLVEPFVEEHSPVEFANSSHFQGRSATWLEKLVPTLLSDRDEVAILSAFHFAIEAYIKSQQNRVEVLRRVGAIEPLKMLASSPKHFASKFAVQALKFIGETVPRSLSSQVTLWDTSDTIYWLEQIKMNDDSLKARFEELQVDGKTLLLLDSHDVLKESLMMTNQITRMKFLRHLNKLKLSCDYQPVDPTKLDKWIRQYVGYEFVQYTFRMLSAGIDRHFLPYVKDDMLINDCAIFNSVHRAKILRAIQDCISKSDRVDVPGNYINNNQQNSSSLLLSPNYKLYDHVDSFPNYSIPSYQLTMPTTPPNASNDTMVPQHNTGSLLIPPAASNRLKDINIPFATPPKKYDVFISYRRSNGSHLASLLKAYMQTRGFSVFIDVEKLASGRFDVGLLHSIKSSRNFILILTANALDRCIDDYGCKDWVHKEILTALENKINIIPVTSNFSYPNKETLPEDIRPLLDMSGISWYHEYQIACIDKIESYFVDTSPSVFSTPGSTISKVPPRFSTAASMTSNFSPILSVTGHNDQFSNSPFQIYNGIDGRNRDKYDEVKEYNGCQTPAIFSRHNSEEN